MIRPAEAAAVGGISTAELLAQLAFVDVVDAPPSLWPSWDSSAVSVRVPELGSGPGWESWRLEETAVGGTVQSVIVSTSSITLRRYRCRLAEQLTWPFMSIMFPCFMTILGLCCILGVCGI